MKVNELTELITKVCGLAENWGKVCIYYCMATHKLRLINWMAVLDIVAVQGSGKSYLIDILRHLAYKPYMIVCHERMTSTTLRNELTTAKNGTAVIEEANLYPNRRELESYLINRVDKRRTSGIAVTQQVATASGAIAWKTDKFQVFGATIIHDRHEMVDMAAERRSITVNIKRQKGKPFVKPDEKLLQSLSLPSFDYGAIPDIFTAPETTGSALDAWEPLIRVAESIGDTDWPGWAWEKVAEMSDKLADGQQFELEQEIFSAVIKAYNDNSGLGLMPDRIANEPLPLSQVTEIVRKEYEFIHPKTVSTKLRRMGFNRIDKVGGVFKVFTTIDQIRKIAKEIGYEDKQL